MFGLKGRDTFNKPTSDIGMIIKKVRELWIKLFPIIFWFMALCIVVIIGYAWYSYLYKKDVTEEKKQTYVNKQMSKVVFKKKDFDILKDTIYKRREFFEKQKDVHKNIFYEQELLQKESIEKLQKEQQKEKQDALGNIL